MESTFKYSDFLELFRQATEGTPLYKIIIEKGPECRVKEDMGLGELSHNSLLIALRARIRRLDGCGHIRLPTTSEFESCKTIGAVYEEFCERLSETPNLSC